MSKNRIVIWHGGRWISTLVVSMLALVAVALSVKAGTSIVAWGAGTTVNINSLNDFGQSIVPKNLTNAVQVAGGWRQSLAVKADGTLEGWGWGGDSLDPTNFPPGSNYLCVACGDLHNMALKSDGTVVVIGDDFYGQLDVPANLSNVVSVACGYYHCLALKSDGTVVAWGAGTIVNPEDGIDYGQSIIPAGLSNVVAIAAGGYHNLVLKSDGTLLAWGDNTYGETNIPSGLSNVVAIAAGADHNLVLRTDGTVTAWGLDNSNQTDVPSGLSNVVAIAAKGDHNLALKANGTVVAWGQDTEGDINVPANLSNVVQIAAGDMHSLALVGNAPPIIQAVAVEPSFGTNGFSFWLPTQNGRVYQLEFNNSLMENSWQGSPLNAGNDGGIWFTDQSAFQPQRFYRVLRW